MTRARPRFGSQDAGARGGVSGEEALEYGSFSRSRFWVELQSSHRATSRRHQHKRSACVGAHLEPRAQRSLSARTRIAACHGARKSTITPHRQPDRVSDLSMFPHTERRSTCNGMDSAALRVELGKEDWPRQAKRSGSLEGSMADLHSLQPGLRDNRAQRRDPHQNRNTPHTPGPRMRCKNLNTNTFQDTNEKKMKAQNDAKKQNRKSCLRRAVKPF